MNTSTNQVESDVVDKCINSENDVVIDIELCHLTTLDSGTRNEVPIMASTNDNICSQDTITLRHGEIEDSKHANTTEQRMVESSAAAHDLNSKILEVE
ncbi:unnamed protein product [Rotaria sp. Silwood1]|nr:unnamed protein product [Rotaria sp. Silwood1]CAF3703393.1 unnamed protein product [Rotaria sp. Silwood1]CAF3705798.1 unnamed protein product [Rotaria sp. Silwood1]CAF3726070.1 unnamed protein product [Rotaria sp. Silwood1]CAF4738345.1 unnamed protein product [Rotaria sp. Silwood1]